MPQFSAWIQPQSPEEMYGVSQARQHNPMVRSYIPHTSFAEAPLATDPIAYLQTIRQLSMRTAMPQGMDPASMSLHGHYNPHEYKPYVGHMNMAAPPYHQFAGRPPLGFPNGQRTGDHSRLHFSAHPERVPLNPRGPPLKPKQSGYALWAGNLPGQTSIIDLKNHFARDATDDIESVFLMNKSNCAFVNYKTREARDAAIRRFNGSQYGGGRLVCRMRKDADRSKSNNNSNSQSDAVAVNVNKVPQSPSQRSASERSQTSSDEGSATRQDSVVNSSDIAKSADPPAKKGDRYFIVKSLTKGDVDASVRQGTWETQHHNERTFDEAYRTAENVYLIFSVNKSGEYFGCARMNSAIFNGEDVAEQPASQAETAEGSQSKQCKLVGDNDNEGDLKVIPTPATETAPKGYIVDDSARGTLFWEVDTEPAAEHATEDGIVSKAGAGRFGRANKSRLFRIEWLSMRPIPFGQTRGMKNALNENREVKVAKDGTELETEVGSRLLAMFRPNLK